MTKEKPPMGISQWIEHGKKYGYFDYVNEGEIEQEKRDQEFIEHCDLIMDLSVDIGAVDSKKEHVRLVKERISATRAFYKWYKELCAKISLTNSD